MTGPESEPEDGVTGAIRALDASTLAVLSAVRAIDHTGSAPVPPEMGPLARALDEVPAAAIAALSDERLTRIVIGLCGGIGFTDRRRLTARRDRLRRCLEDDRRPWDERRRAAVELDADVDARLDALDHLELQLRPGDVHDRFPLAPLLADRLAKLVPPDRVVDALWAVAADPRRTDVERGDALAALAMAGDEPLAAWRAVLGNLGSAESSVRQRTRELLHRALVRADDALARVDGARLLEELTLGVDAHEALAAILATKRESGPVGPDAAPVLLAAEAAERGDGETSPPAPKVHSASDAAEQTRLLAIAPTLSTAAILERLPALMARGGAGMAIALDTLGQRLREDPRALMRALAELPLGGRSSLLADLGVPVGPGLGRVTPVGTRALSVLHAWAPAAPDLAAGLLAILGAELAADGQAAHALGLLVDLADDRTERIARTVIDAAPDEEQPLLERLWSIRTDSTGPDRRKLVDDLRRATGVGATGLLLRSGKWRIYQPPAELAAGHPSAIAASVEVCRWTGDAEGGGKGAAKLFNAIAEGPIEEWRELQLFRLLDEVPSPIRDRYRTRLVERLAELGPIAHPDLRRLAPASAVPAEIRLGWSVVVLAAQARDALRALDAEEVGVDPDGVLESGPPLTSAAPPPLTLTVDGPDGDPVKVTVGDTSEHHPTVSIAAQEALLRERDLDLDPSLADALAAAARAARDAGVPLSAVLTALQED